MATFTLTLKRVIEINQGNIGLGSYPVWNDDYRAALNQKIIDHYWNREIGQETISMFTFAMRRKMNEIMPYFNKLYESEQIKYDALKTIDIETITEGASTASNTTNTNSSDKQTSVNETENDGKSRSVNSITPQTMLKPNQDYATGATDSNSDAKAKSESNAESNNFTNANENSNSNENANSKTSGFTGVASDLIMRYRESLLNIDMMVIAQLEELFSYLWGNGDSYTESGYGF